MRSKPASAGSRWGHAHFMPSVDVVNGARRRGSQISRFSRAFSVMPGMPPRLPIGNITS